MPPIIILVVSIICARCTLSANIRSSTNGNHKFALLRGLLSFDVYDKLTYPGELYNSSTKVNVFLYIQSISSLAASTMDYQIDFYLRTSWVDPRLQHSHSTHITTNDQQLVSLLWQPDIYVVNAKSSQFQTVTVPNMGVRIYPDGIVWLSNRVTATLICNMHLDTYPADEQHCSIKLAPYYSVTEQLEIAWHSVNDSIVLDTDIELPDFTIIQNNASRCSALVSNETGVFSCIMANFAFERHSGYHLYQIYIPSIVVVSLSWISFWISPRAVPARITLSITTFLALSTLFSNSSGFLPPVSYATAIDVWMTLCTLFVYAALLEFTLVYHLWEQTIFEKAIEQADSCRKVVPTPDTTAIHQTSPTRSAFNRGRMTMRSTGVLRRRQWSSGAVVQLEEMYGGGMDPGIGIGGGSQIDRLCRIAFPLAFFASNCAYFLKFSLHLDRP